MFEQNFMRLSAAVRDLSH